MDFRERVPFGRTGLMVSRMGLASGYGVPTAAIEKAFHEYGVNYFYLSFLKRSNMVRAIQNLAPKHRDELRIVLAWTFFGGFRMPWNSRSVHSSSSFFNQRST